MADNVSITAGSGTTIAADDIAGVLYQRVKISQGADGVATDVSSAAPLHVTLANTGANATPVVVDLGANNDVTVTGTVAVTQSGTWDEVGINDSGNSITVDNSSLSVVGGGTEATAMRVTLASDSTGVLSVDDNGGSITVDGTVSITANSAVNVAQINGVTPLMGAGATGTGSPRVTAASDSPEVTALQIMDDWDNGASDGASVSGDVAHGTADAGEPVKIGGKALSADPTAEATGDRVNALFDLIGRQVMFPYSLKENLVSGAITTAMTGTTSTSLIAAPGAGLYNYITQITVSNAHGTVGTDIAIQDGSGGTTIYTIPAAAVYGGAVVTFPAPLKQPTANTALFCANVTTGASTKVSASGFKSS